VGIEICEALAVLVNTEQQPLETDVVTILKGKISASLLVCVKVRTYPLDPQVEWVGV
jgi:hypothetical protein